jgi:hypothetical protein
MMPGEIRMPSALLSEALHHKQTKMLRLFATAKLRGHRSELNALYTDLKIHPKTGGRLIKKIVHAGWAGTDGKYLFPRSWERLQTSKRRGLYVSVIPKDQKKFDALCFAHALKKIIGKKAGPRHTEVGSILPKADLPHTYLCAALGIKERRFKTLKASAQRYKFIAVTPQFTRLGFASEYNQIKKNIHGPPVFKKGRFTVVPAISKIRVLI